MHPVFIISLIITGLGLIGVWLIIKKSHTRNHPILKKSLIYLLIVVVSIIAVVYHFFPVFIVLIMIGIWVELIRILIQKKENLIVNLIFITVYALISSGFFIYSLNAQYDQLLLLLLVVYTFDAFSQITGQLLGKHKLLPRISPNKTWEGLLGGLLISLVAAITANIWMKNPVVPTLSVTTIIVFAALTGDLLASLVKRTNNIKDFSNWIPGQGGFLDRFDSLIFAGFCVGLYYQLF